MDKETKNLLVFGYGLTAILGFVAGRVWIKYHNCAVALTLGLAAVTVLLVTATDHLLLRSFYKRWMTAAHAIGAVISGVLLAILFYAVFGIAGIVLRLMRRDLLDQRLEPDKDSYWHPRPAVPYDPVYMRRQF